MKMDSRQRLLTVLNNEKPDRLPCQVHCWMDYYLKTYLGGVDQYQAYSRFGMDAVIYVEPDYIFKDRDKINWNCQHKELGQDGDGNWLWVDIINTPEGVLTTKSALDLAKGAGIEMPITQEVYHILYEGKDKRAAVSDLMERDLKSE